MSDCGVCLATYDCDAVFLGWQIRRCRKPKHCAECGHPILEGELYEYAKGITDGEWWSQNTCLVCKEIGEAFYCDGRCFGNLWEEMHDQVFPALTVSCFDKLKTPQAKADLQARWLAWKGLSCL
jgi:hypothetical protein